ncbi:MAG: hypothetical protein HYZ40_09125 [Rhodospirillales bacterium]|nr:hypothetical protein [Rhodospirillales bacterium]
MKLDAARRLGEVRRFCIMIDKTVPRWALVLFAASLGALCLVELDRRFYSMGKYTPIYINLNYVIAASTFIFIAARVYRAYRR